MTSTNEATRARESKPSEQSEPRWVKEGRPRDVLIFAGVEICKEGEDLPEEEIERRFREAEAALWKGQHERGILPLGTSTKP